MKSLLFSFIIIFFSIAEFAQAKQLGFSCKGANRMEPTNRVYFNIILDTSTYKSSDHSIEALIYLNKQLGKVYKFVKVEAFYVSPSKTNPQYYIRGEQLDYYGSKLDVEVYPLAEKMLGHTSLTLRKNGISMEGSCQRADFLDDTFK